MERPPDTGTTTIEIAGIELHGFHGVLEEERRHGQRFLVDLELEPAAGDAAQSDRLEDAVDYRNVVALVRDVSDARAYHLLEAFADALADALIGSFGLMRVRVRVRKPDVRLALDVDHAAVIVERRAATRGSEP